MRPTSKTLHEAIDELATMTIHVQKIREVGMLSSDGCLLEKGHSGQFRSMTYAEAVLLGTIAVDSGQFMASEKPETHFSHQVEPILHAAREAGRVFSRTGIEDILDMMSQSILTSKSCESSMSFMSLSEELLGNANRFDNLL